VGQVKKSVRDKLLGLLALTTSPHDGEALNAARLANRLLRKEGLTWGEVLARPTFQSGGMVHDYSTVFGGVGRQEGRSRQAGRRPSEDFMASLRREAARAMNVKMDTEVMFDAVLADPPRTANGKESFEALYRHWCQHNHLTTTQHADLRRHYERARARGR